MEAWHELGFVKSFQMVPCAARVENDWSAVWAGHCFRGTQLPSRCKPKQHHPFRLGPDRGNGAKEAFVQKLARALRAGSRCDPGTGVQGQLAQIPGLE